MHSNIGKGKILSIENQWEELMHSCLAVSKDESFSFGGFGFLQCDLIRVYFLYLLVEEKQSYFHHNFVIIKRDVALHPKVDNIVELYFFLIVSQ